MITDEETNKQFKRLRDQIESMSESQVSFAHRQDEFNGVGVDIRAAILRMDANQMEILRQLGSVSARVDKINRKLELVSGA